MSTEFFRKYIDILNEAQQNLNEDNKGIQVYGNNYGYFVWGPTSNVLQISIDPENGNYVLPYKGDDPVIADGIKSLRMHPVDFASLPKETKELIYQHLYKRPAEAEPEATKTEPAPLQRKYKTGGYLTDPQKEIIRRKGQPVAGPKGQLPEGVDTKKIAAEYRSNENRNLHSENVVLLANHFGTPKEQEMAKRALEYRDANDGFDFSDPIAKKYMEFQQIINRKYYPMLNEKGVAEGSYYPGEHGPEGVAIPDPDDVMPGKKSIVKRISPKGKAKKQMLKMYGDGAITFSKTPNGGHFIQHEDDFGDTNSHQYDPQTGKVDFSGAVSSTYYGEDVTEAQTDYQKRRQRERDVDAGRKGKTQPKNPQNDYFARRKKEKQQGLSEGLRFKKP